MSYQVTARKWRPMIFGDVVGQSHVTNTLRNAIASHRVAHAFIFSGARGCGKTTTARILAKALNCLSPKDQDPCNDCEMCKSITNGRSLDVIEIDGASNRGIEEIRNLRESARYTPAYAKRKIYIIDEVHMLTREAFNALLKTLEEPPAHVLFIFATTEVHKVPATILSRCQRFDFRRIALDEIAERLKFIAAEEKIEIDDESLIVIAKKGDGSLRDAQSIFDQVRSYCGNTISKIEVLKTLNVVDQDIYFKLLDLVIAKDIKGAISLVDEIVKSGYDTKEFVSGLIEHFRNLLVACATKSTDLIESSDHHKRRYEQIAVRFVESDILRLLKLANDLDQAIKWSPHPRYRLEIALVHIVSMESSVKVEELLNKIEQLKKKLEASPANTIKSQASNEHTEEQISPKTVPPPHKDIKVLGKVNAGLLQTSVAEKIPVASRISAITESNGYYGKQGFSRPDALPTRQIAPLKLISLEEAKEKWGEWIDEVKRNRVSIGTILAATSVHHVLHDAMQISCPDDYHASTIKRNREFLSETFKKITGHSMRIEPILVSQKPVYEKTQELQSTDGNGNGRSDEEHPVIMALRRELGAEPIE